MGGSIPVRLILPLLALPVAGCGMIWSPLSPPVGLPAFLRPLAACAEAHGYRVPAIDFRTVKAEALSSGAARCCTEGSEQAVRERWKFVGCYGAEPKETRKGFGLRIADPCLGPRGERLTANLWYADHEFTHIVIRAATGHWDLEHADGLWTECSHPFDPRPLFGPDVE